MSDLKEKLFQMCKEYIATRETDIKRAIADAREAANNETKSSAGDKYETSRELMQQEIDLNLGRLNELNKMQSTLDHITPTHTSDIALPGSLVYTTQGNYYIAISAGRLKVEDTFYYAISAASPIGSKITGQLPGYEFTINDKKILIEKVA